LNRHAAREALQRLEASNGESEPPVSLAAARAVRNGHGPAERARRLTVHRLSDVRAKRQQWAWEGRVPVGELSILAGLPGLGKGTTLACACSGPAPRTAPRA
jgi:hypothetical protein